MSRNRAARGPRITTWVAGAAGMAAGAYAAYVSLAWLRYGRPPAPGPLERDELLDRYMPRYDVAERHHARVAAPADTVWRIARELDLQRSTLVRAIFKAREVLLRARPDTVPRPAGLIAQMTSLGWGILAEEPGREIVFGSVTRPWLADVVFRTVPTAGFATFDEPGYVKIAWTLRVEPADTSAAIFRTETRAVATDAGSRARFRWYWARFSPGIVLIREMMVRQLKAEAER